MNTYYWILAIFEDSYGYLFLDFLGLKIIHIYDLPVVVVKSLCPTLSDLMDCKMPGFPALPYLPELARIHVH